MARNNEAKVTFKVFNQDFNKAMSEMDASSRRLRQELKLEQEQLKETGTESEKLGANLKGLQQQHQVASDKVQATAEQLARAKEYFGENSNEAKKLEDKLLALQIAEQRLANEVTVASRQFEAQQEAARALEHLFEATGKSVEDFTDVLGQDLTNAIRNGTATSAQLEQAIDKIGQASLSADGDLELLRRALRQVDDGGSLEDVQRELRDLSQQTEETGSRFEALGEKAKDLSGNISSGLSVAMAGIGTAAVASAIEFDKAQAKIQMSLGLTAKEAQKLEESSTKMWKAGFGESLEEVTDSLIKVKQNMKSVADGRELETVTRDAMVLANTFEADVNEVTRAANNLMVNFGIDSKKAFDLLAYGAQNGLNFSGELFDNVAEYSGLFKTLGFEADEYFQVLMNGSKEGVYNLDYLNDVVKEFGIRIKDGSATTSDAIATLFAPDDIDVFIQALEKGGKATEEYQQLLSKVSSETADELVKNLQKGGKSFSDTSVALMGIMGDYDEFFGGLEDGSLKGSEAMQMVIGKIQELESPTDRAALGVALFGTKWEDLEETAMFGLTAVGNEIENATGTMDKMAEVQEQTFGQRFSSILRTTQSALEPLGTVMLDLAERVLPIVSVAIATVSEWFGNLSPTIQLLIVAIGAIIALIGPLAIIFSGLVSPIGLVVAAIALLVSALVAAYTQSESFREGVATVFEAVKSTIETVIGVVVSYLKEKFAEIKKFWDENGTQILQAVEKAFNGIKKVIEFVMPFVKSLIVDTWNAIKNVIDGALNIIMGLIKTFSGLLTGDFSKMWEGIKQLFSGAVEAIWGLLQLGFLGKIFKVVKGFGDDAFRVIQDMTGKMKGKFDEIVSAGKSKFDDLKSKIMTPINKAKEEIGVVIDAIKGFFTNLKLKLPKIDMPKLPHFKLTGSFSLNPPSVPKLGIEWYAKGGLMTKPTAFGMNGNNLMVGGEVPGVNEAILPLTDRVLGSIGTMIAQTMPQPTQPTLYIQPAPIILDGRVIAEATFEVTSNMQYNSTAIAAQMKGLNWG